MDGRLSFDLYLSFRQQLDRPRSGREALSAFDWLRSRFGLCIKPDSLVLGGTTM